jgi:hypothetical protein
MGLPENIANEPLPIATLTAPVKPEATVFPVNQPAPVSLQGAGQFRIVVENEEEEAEIALVVGGASTSSWVVERAQEGTTALAFVAGTEVSHELTAGAVKTFAPLNSPALTGVPTAPTATAKTNSTQIATTAAVQTAKGEAEAASDKAGAAATAQAAAEAASIPLTQKGAASGVASLTAGSIGAQLPAHHASTHAEGGTDPLTVGDLPSSVVSSRPKSLGEVEGAVTPNLTEGNIFELTLKAATTLEKPSNWPTGYSEQLLVIRQNSAGSHAITWGAGIAPLGVSINTEPNGVTRVILVSENGGTTVEAVSAIEGREGPRGAEGKVGPEGTKGANGAAGATGPPGATGATKALGEVSGTVKCNLGEAFAFTMTITGNVTIVFENWPAGLCEPELFITQDVVGGHTIAVTGLVWKGEEPEYATGANAVTIIPVSSPNGGSTIYGIANKGPKGSEGAKGSTGATGGAGPGAYTGLLVPYHTGVFAATASLAIGEANKAIFCLMLCEKTGKLKRLVIPNGSTVNGNWRVGVFDCGIKEAEQYFLLAEEEAAQAGTSKNQTITIPEVAVTAGELLMIGLMNSGTTGTCGTSGTFLAAANSELPSEDIAVGLWPATMGVARLAGQHKFSEFKFKTLAKAEMEASEKKLMVCGVIQ